MNYKPTNYELEQWFKNYVHISQEELDAIVAKAYKAGRQYEMDTFGEGI